MDWGWWVRWGFDFERAQLTWSTFSSRCSLFVDFAVFAAHIPQRGEGQLAWGERACGLGQVAYLPPFANNRRVAGV
jgi:hypothetical protein